MPIFLVTILFGSVLIQGGYFPNFFLPAGVLLSLALLVPHRRICFPKHLVPLAILALWYPIAALAGGGGVDSLCQSMLPLCCLLFAVLCVSLSPCERKTLLLWIRRLSGVVALCAILAFFANIPGTVTAHRLQFTFQYVNAAGVFFACAALLRREVPDKFSDWLYPFVLVALLLTRSVGALGLFVPLQLYVLWKDRKTLGTLRFWVPSALLILGSFVAIISRFSQALGTFQERLVQSGDGLRGLLASPIFGYGAGNWPAVKPLFQSYDYRAQVVHNSYVQTGVEAGFPALLLLAAAVLWVLWLLRKQSPALKAAALLIPLHAVLDFSLCFFAVDCLFLSVVSLPSDSGQKPLPPWSVRLSALIVSFILAALAVWRNAV